MAADLKKSLVHIQERFINPGTIVADVAVPATAGIATPATVTLTGVALGDTIIAAQPTATADAITGTYVTSVYVTATNTAKVQFAGTGAGGTKSYTFYILGSDA